MCTRPSLGASDGGDLGPRRPSPHAPSWQTLIRDHAQQRFHSSEDAPSPVLGLVVGSY